jgi:hypothetical protein
MFNPFGKPDVEFLENGDYHLWKKCSVTGKLFDLVVPWDQFIDWRNGALIQDALEDFTPDQREFVQTGITPAEWDSMFK